MGVTAENLSLEWQISREERDTFAAASQNKAEGRQEAGRFKDGSFRSPSVAQRAASSSTPTSSSRDGVTVDTLAKLRPAFNKGRHRHRRQRLRHQRRRRGTGADVKAGAERSLTRSPPSVLGDRRSIRRS